MIATGFFSLFPVVPNKIDRIGAADYEPLVKYGRSTESANMREESFRSFRFSSLPRRATCARHLLHYMTSINPDRQFADSKPMRQAVDPRDHSSVESAMPTGNNTGKLRLLANDLRN
jgi:hypothetical protein